MNRNKLIELFISNLSNAVVHQILEKAIAEQVYIDKYRSEFRNSWQIAKIYREKINPTNRSLPFHDLSEIKEKIIKKVNCELNIRINRGYKNINLELVEELVDNALKELNVS
jgi:hypothetical protein